MQILNQNGIPKNFQKALVRLDLWVVANQNPQVGSNQRVLIQRNNKHHFLNKAISSIQENNEKDQDKAKQNSQTPGEQLNETMKAPSQNEQHEKSPPRKQEKLNVDYQGIPNEMRSVQNDLKLDQSDQQSQRNVAGIQPEQIFGLVGLINQGNTCFLNSAIQCLSNIQPLADYFLSDIHLEEINENSVLGSKGEITQSFANLIQMLWNNQDQILKPVTFHQMIEQHGSRFASGTQEDAQQFIIYLLDILHEDLNRVQKKPYIVDKDFIDSKSDLQKKKRDKTYFQIILQYQGFSKQCWGNYLSRNRSIIVDLFQGQTKCTLECLQCETQSHKFEPFMYLSIPVPDEDITRRIDDPVSIESCLEDYLKKETLEDGEQWYCPTCKTHRKSTMKIDLWKLPNILIIHLKSGMVAGPQREQPVYDLVSVVNHQGSLGRGHYYTYARNLYNQQWYNFNDTSVQEINQEQISSNEAYVLIYFKTSVDEFFRQTLSAPQLWPYLSQKDQCEEETKILNTQSGPKVTHMLQFSIKTEQQPRSQSQPNPFHQRISFQHSISRRTSTRAGYNNSGLQSYNEASLLAVHVPTPNLDGYDIPHFGQLDDSYMNSNTQNKNKEEKGVHHLGGGGGGTFQFNSNLSKSKNLKPALVMISKNGATGRTNSRGDELNDSSVQLISFENDHIIDSIRQNNNNQKNNVNNRIETFGDKQDQISNDQGRKINNEIDFQQKFSFENSKATGRDKVLGKEGVGIGSRQTGGGETPQQGNGGDIRAERAGERAKEGEQINNLTLFSNKSKDKLNTVSKKTFQKNSIYSPEILKISDPFGDESAQSSQPSNAVDGVHIEQQLPNVSPTQQGDSNNKTGKNFHFNSNQKTNQNHLLNQLLLDNQIDDDKSDNQLHFDDSVKLDEGDNTLKPQGIRTGTFVLDDSTLVQQK